MVSSQLTSAKSVGDGLSGRRKSVLSRLEVRVALALGIAAAAGHGVTDLLATEQLANRICAEAVVSRLPSALLALGLDGASDLVGGASDGLLGLVKGGLLRVWGGGLLCLVGEILAAIDLLVRW